MDWKRIEGSILDRDVEISKSGDRFLRPCGNFTMFFAKDLEQFRSVQLTREWWRGSSNKSSISQWARTVSCWPFNVMAQWIMQKLIGVRVRDEGMHVFISHCYLLHPCGCVVIQPWHKRSLEQLLSCVLLLSQSGNLMRLVSQLLKCHFSTDLQRSLSLTLEY